jgi:hypothetical protein
MNAAARKFEDVPAVRVGHMVPLIIGVTAPQGAGKTWSSLRLGTGIQRVVGGEIFVIDADDGRALNYADYFKFRHVPFDPPHGPDDYREAIAHCAKRGASIIIIDQMSSEHDGEGGVLDQIDDYIEKKGGGEQHKWTAHIEPKKARRKLNREIVHLAKSIVFILLYRAEEKTRPGSGGKAQHLGLQTISTSNLPYNMTVRFLLPPGSDGVPVLQPTTPGERLLTKNPEQFKGWFEPGQQLSEEMGERMASWARGDVGANEFDRLIGDYAKCNDAATFERLKLRRNELWQKDSPHKPRLKEASDAAAKRLKEAAAASRTVPTDQGGGKAEKVPEGETSASPSGSVTDINWTDSFNEQTSSLELDVLWKRCLEAFKDHVPPDIYDAYEGIRERLVEREATRTDDY